MVPPQTLVRGVPGSNPARNAHLELSRNALPGGEVKEGLPPPEAAPSLLLILNFQENEAAPSLSLILNY